MEFLGLMGLELTGFVLTEHGPYGFDDGPLTSMSIMDLMCFMVNVNTNITIPMFTLCKESMFVFQIMGREARGEEML